MSTTKKAMSGPDAECVAALEDHIENNRTTLYDAHALIRASEAAARSEGTDPAVLARTLHIAAMMIETALEQLDIVSIREVQNKEVAHHG